MNIKSSVTSDRYSILKSILVEMKKTKLDTREFAMALENSISKVLDREFVIAKPTKPKKFRKISGYIAFCKSFRIENRVAKDPIKNVHEVTKAAGKSWKSLNETQKNFWKKSALEMTSKAKEAFENSKKNETKPSVDDIDESTTKQLKNIAKKYNVVFPKNANADDMKFLLKYSLELN